LVVSQVEHMERINSKKINTKLNFPPMLVLSSTFRNSPSIPKNMVRTNI
jgi:hypothetical protein